jgi:hypothetical protein
VPMPLFGDSAMAPLGVSLWMALGVALGLACLLLWRSDVGMAVLACVAAGGWACERAGITLVGPSGLAQAASSSGVGPLVRTMAVVKAVGGAPPAGASGAAGGR